MEYHLSATTKALNTKLGKPDDELDEQQQIDPELTHWSQAYLTSSLDLVVTNRQRINAGMKAIEAANRVDFNEAFSEIATQLCETVDAEVAAERSPWSRGRPRRLSFRITEGTGTAVSRAMGAAKRSMRRLSTGSISSMRWGKGGTSFGAAGMRSPATGLRTEDSAAGVGQMSARSSATVHTFDSVQRRLEAME